MNATLRDRLIQVEQLFLIAVVAQDETALKEFSLELSRLIHHFKAVEASGGLDDDTALYLSHVSQVIRATTQCVLECEDVLTDIQTGLISGSKLPLSPDLLPVPTSCPTFTPYRLLFSHFSSSGTLGILGHNKHLDAYAYRWLLQNMHNPYPTPIQLQTMGDESMTSMAQAEFWFQEARDLIGWTRLSDEFFTGSLSATITAAKQVYLEHDNTVPFCIAFAFSKVKATMETLFSERPALPTTLTSPVGCSARALQPAPVVNNSRHFSDHLDNEEIEDTTPPPSVAGYKRNLPEDMATSLTSDLHRPLKRLRAQSPHQLLPRSESLHPLSNTAPSSKKSATEALTHTSVIPVTSVQLSNPSFPVGSKLSPGSLAFDPTEQMQTDPYGSASEPVVSHVPSISQGEMRNQQITDGSPPVPPERRFSPSVNHRWYPSPCSAPNVAWPVPASLSPPTDSIGASQITVSPGAPVDLSVFDWNSIPGPLVETTTSTNQPASVYVTSSDLAALNFELPDPLYLEQSAEKRCNLPCSLDDLGSLEDLGLPQFPIPTTFPPDVSASHSASFCSNNSLFSSQEMDWAAITDFINQFSTFSAESSSAPSPSATFDAAPSTPENPIGSLFPPEPQGVNKPISVMDPSIPPSVFFSAEPGIFTEDASMWSLLCGLS
ncbi:hypothetical protein EDB89DRAFT_2239329 [Lactarius sanguifluus]|nr:hypothetical protein EDB89DRAFT_2239329 [Lactarius sanguifluus]